MTLQEILINLGGGAGVVGAALAALRSKKARSALSRALSIVDSSEWADSLKNLKDVVEAQGQSIEWLRDELSNTRLELATAREQLAKTESLAIENAALRTRVADLEAHVRRLEDELQRRRGGRPRK